MVVFKKMTLAAMMAVLMLLSLPSLAFQGSGASAQSVKSAGDGTVALINGKPITSSEFKERFELTVYPHKEIRSGVQAEKERFLFSLIAERLLADEGMKSGKFMSPEENQLRLEATQTYLRDALYRKEILSRVIVTDKQVMDGIKNAAYRYFIRVYYFPDSSRARAFHEECSHADPSKIDSLAAARHVPADTGHVVFGELVRTQEDAFWGKHTGYLTGPVRGQGPVVLIQVLSRQIDTEFSMLSLQEKEEKIRKIIRMRDEISATEKYVMSFLGSAIARAAPNLVTMLADSIASELRGQEPSSFPLYYNLTPGEIGDLLKKFRDQSDLPMVLIHWTDNSRKDISMSLGEVINSLLPAEFLAKSTSVTDVATGLRNTLRRVIEYSLLAGQADKLGLENSPEVRKNVGLIMRAYFASKMKEDLLDTVHLSRSDLENFMHEYNASGLKNIRLTFQEFNATTVGQAVSLYNSVSALDTMNEALRFAIMRHMDIDTVTANAFMLGSIGSLFARLSPGHIYGPVQNKSGYTLFRLLSKQSSISDTALTLAVDTTKMIALSAKRDSVLYHYVASLAAKSDVRIFLKALGKVEVEPMQMFTVRKIGFGGTINAVPGLAVCEDWTKAAPMREIIIP